MSKQKKYHYIYKTTCEITGKFYVGMHSTDNLEDNYLGSGKILGYSRNKYGDEAHVKEILEYALDRKSLATREKEIVNEELLSDPLNINLKYGGDGGGKFYTETQQRNATIAGNRSPNRKRASYQKGLRTRHERGDISFRNSKGNWKGLQHTTSTKNKMSASHQGKHDGEKNSQFGTCWMTDGLKPIKIKKEQLDEYILKGYARGRVLKSVGELD